VRHPHVEAVIDELHRSRPMRLDLHTTKARYLLVGAAVAVIPSRLVECIGNDTNGFANGTI
jgi:hypothetical protein